jgi:hypothetical protein
VSLDWLTCPLRLSWGCVSVAGSAPFPLCSATHCSARSTLAAHCPAGALVKRDGHRGQRVRPSSMKNEGWPARLTHSPLADDDRRTAGRTTFGFSANVGEAARI